MTKQKADEMLTKIHQAIVGNGVKGLNDRMSAVEEYINDHPRICPLEIRKKEIWKVRAFEISVIAVLLTLIQLAFRLAGLI